MRFFADIAKSSKTAGNYMQKAPNNSRIFNNAESPFPPTVVKAG